jgi:hypothetical protein
VRQRAYLQVGEFVEALAHYGLCLDRVAYGRLERGRRAPRFAELLPLYQALSAGCGILFTSEECLSYLLLARSRIERLHKQRQAIPRERWSKLAEEIAQFETLGQPACPSTPLPHTVSHQTAESPALVEHLTQAVRGLSPTLQDLVLAELRTVVETIAAQPALALLAQMGSNPRDGERGSYVR